MNMTLLNVIDFLVGAIGISCLILAFLCCSCSDDDGDEDDLSAASLLMIVGGMFTATAVLIFVCS